MVLVTVISSVQRHDMKAPLQTKLVSRMHKIIFQKGQSSSYVYSARSAPKRQCQGVEVCSLNLRQYFMGAK